MQSTSRLKLLHKHTCGIFFLEDLVMKSMSSADFRSALVSCAMNNMVKNRIEHDISCFSVCAFKGLHYF